MGTKKVLLLVVVLVVTAAQSSIADQTRGAGVGVGVASRGDDDDRGEPGVFRATGDGIDNFFGGMLV
jgi:hypothetical protein